MRDPTAKCTVQRAGDLRDNHLVLQCFGHRAAYMVMRALYLRDVEHRSWNSLLVEFYRMSVGTRKTVLPILILSALPVHSCQKLPVRTRTRSRGSTCNQARPGTTFPSICSSHYLARRIRVPGLRIRIGTTI